MQSLWARLGIVSFTAAACLTIFPAAAQTGGWVDPPDEIETPAPRVIPIPPPTSQERSEPAPRATPPPPREAAPAPPPNTHEIAPIPRQAAPRQVAPPPREAAPRQVAPPPREATPREAAPTPREATPRQVAPPPREAAPAPREAAPPPREAAPREVAPAPGVREATPRRAEPPAARAERRPAPPPRAASRPRPERTARSPAPSAADIELVLEAERLTLDYLDAWSGPNPYALAQMPDFYGPQVVFHGRRMSIRALMDEKRRFASRWPMRDYRPVPESFRADCAARAAFCKVRVLAEFDAADPRRGRRSRGVLTLELDVRVTPDGPLIVAENSRVMDRGPRARGN